MSLSVTSQVCSGNVFGCEAGVGGGQSRTLLVPNIRVLDPEPSICQQDPPRATSFWQMPVLSDRLLGPSRSGPAMSWG